MNKWLGRLLLLSEIGGGFLGITLIAQNFALAERNLNFIIVNAAFGAVFLLGIIAGLALIESPRRGVVLSGLYQALQIPTIILPSVQFNVGSGFVSLVYFGQTGFSADFYLGAKYSFCLYSEVPWSFGVNLIALLLFIYLVVLDRRHLRELHPKKEETSGGAPDLWASPIRRKINF